MLMKNFAELNYYMMIQSSGPLPQPSFSSGPFSYRYGLEYEIAPPSLGPRKEVLIESE